MKGTVARLTSVGDIAYRLLESEKRRHKYRLSSLYFPRSGGQEGVTVEPTQGATDHIYSTI